MRSYLREAAKSMARDNAPSNQLGTQFRLQLAGLMEASPEGVSDLHLDLLEVAQKMYKKETKSYSLSQEVIDIIEEYRQTLDISTDSHALNSLLLMFKDSGMLDSVKNQFSQSE